MTKQEKTVIYFLIAILVLGLAVKFYKACSSRARLKIEKVDLKTGPYLGVGKVDINKIVKEKLLVKLNSASAEDFARLPGIGPGLAKRIVDYRDKNGSFVTIEDINKVSGIGEKKYEAIKDFLVVE